ncbi:MAG: zinc-binding dehydrogenase [Sphingomonadaceae bacterium]|nr:zinc-binding dehydrogenase [Sphingomonadaceae bacterium]
MTANRIAIVRRAGGPERVEVIDAATPVPRAGDVLIAVEATGVAFADVVMRKGVYPGVGFPFTPGYEVVGRVVSGDGIAPGTRVAALTVTGGAARLAVVPAADCVAVPDAVPSVQAAALVLNGLTAWQMLTRCVAQPSVETMLVWGAAGGVGSVLLALGRHFGIRTFGVASGSRQDFVRQRGATPIDRAGDVAAQVRAASDGGVDAAFDGVGGPNVRISEAALRPGGCLVMFGFQGALGGERLNPLKAAAAVLRSPRRSAQAQFLAGTGRRGYLIGQWKDAHPAFYRDDLAAILALAAEGRLVADIAAELPLDRIADAHRMMAAGTQPGKIVIRP